MAERAVNSGNWSWRKLAEFGNLTLWPLNEIYRGANENATKAHGMVMWRDLVDGRACVKSRPSDLRKRSTAEDTAEGDRWWAMGVFILGLIPA